MKSIINQIHGIDYSGELSPEALAIVKSFEPENADSVRAKDTDLTLARNEHGLAEHDIPLPSLGEPSPIVSEKNISPGDRNVRIRIYTPATKNDNPLPLFVFAHGGCWAFCSLDTHDRICQYICHHANCIVVSVDYALAPEHPFPEGLNDYCSAISWCHENARLIGADPTKIAVGGDSAGGNLAAVASLKLATESSLSLCLQVLIYPICEVPASSSQSLTKYAKGYFFTAEMLTWSSSLYLQKNHAETSGNNPMISPIAADIPASLAPALFIIPECDILRDQALAYAKKLTSAGVSTHCHYYFGMPHAFVAMAGSLSLGQRALDDCVRGLKHAFQENY